MLTVFSWTFFFSTNELSILDHRMRNDITVRVETTEFRHLS